MIATLYGWLERRIDVFALFDDKRTPPDTLTGFWTHYIRPVRGWMVVVLFSSLAIAALDAALFAGVGRFVDILGTTTPERLWAEHGNWLLGALALVLVARPLAIFANEAIVNQAVIPQTTNQIRWRTHSYTLGHSLSYFQGDFAGRLANRIFQSGAALREATVSIMDVVWYALAFVATTLALFGSISLWLTLPLLAWFAAYAALLRVFIPLARDRSRENAEKRSALLGRIVDSYTNIQTVKLFARGDEERSAVKRALAEHMDAYLRSLRLHSSTTGALTILNASLIASTSILSGWLWSRGAMTPGSIAASLALVMRIQQMSTWMMQTVRGVFDNVGVVQESMETISRPHAVVDAPEARPLKVERGEIRFEDVTFHYGKGRGVIEGLNLVVRPGEKVGLVGPSGAGKSTLVSLLLRLHDLEGGRILVDGQDIAGVTQDSLRQAVAVVSQESSLLHRSIRDNILYGRPDADQAALEAAARFAQAHDFIQELEDDRGRQGYEARAGERGVKLSGGQRQRVGIARVLLKDAPILVLDEATSALDSGVEAAIQEQLTRLMAGKTVIAIAHRLSTIAALDRLVVLEGGRIVEEGRHEDLVRSGGLYASLWSRQTGGFLTVRMKGEARRALQEAAE